MRIRRALAESIIPALRDSGAHGGGDPYYVSRQWEPPVRSEAWLTLVASPESGLPDVIDVERPHVARSEFGNDPILERDAAWYRHSLRQITDIAIEVMDSGESLPVRERDIVRGDAEARRALVE